MFDYCDDDAKNCKFANYSDHSDDIDFDADGSDEYGKLWDIIYFEIIHQIRYNKYILGDYHSNKLSFLQAIYN